MQWILHAAVMFSLGATGVQAPTGAAATEWVPTLVVRGIQAQPESAQVIGERKLAKSEPLAVTIWTGSSLCHIGIGEPAQPAAVPQNVWKMTGDYLGERDGRHQIRVRSGFTRLSGADAGGTTTQTLSLREGDSVVLDALSAPVDASCGVHVVTLEAQLALQPTDPALARARYAADMWLIHTDPGGKEQREHLVTTIDGSTVVPFMFNRLAFPIPQVDPRQGNAEAVIQLTGALRVRPRGNGTVFLDLETNRFLFGLENPDAPLRSSPTTLRMEFTTSEGETVAVDFPPPSSGFSSIALTKDGTTTVRVRPGKLTPSKGSVSVKEGKLVLYTFEFFRGHKTQLLITLRRLP